MTGEVQFKYTKWGGHRHWEFALVPIDEDRFGRWFGGRAGLSLRRGDEEPIEQAFDTVQLVPAAGSWTAYWNAAPAEVEVYVDVTTEPVCTAGLITMVDLDLDVVRFWDGRVEVLDEDEFAEHQVRYGYPAEVIEQALATTAGLVDAVGRRTEPFGEVGSRRLREFTGADPGR